MFLMPKYISDYKMPVIHNSQRVTKSNLNFNYKLKKSLDQIKTIKEGKLKIKKINKNF